MNVTDQVIRSHELYGGSDSTNPAYYSSNRSLNYAKTSNSLLGAQVEKVTAIPLDVNYKDSVGLFGAENVFIKVQLDIENTISVIANNGITINTYLPAKLDLEFEDNDLFYESAVMDYKKDLFEDNTYEPATINNSLELIAQPLVSIDLNNLKTGNKYIDAWFDVRLYTKDRIEFPYDKMYINPKSFFYLGFHARNTKRLPYNVRMTVGNSFISEYDLPQSERRYIDPSN